MDHGFDFSGEEMALFESLMLKNEKRARANDRPTMNAIFCVLLPRMPPRNLSKRYGPLTGSPS
jgi:hypothetical protein